DKILSEYRGRGCRYVTGEQGQIERAGFLQAAGSRGETESARKRSFGGGLFHGRRVRRASAVLMEGTSDPPRGRKRFLQHRRRSRGSWLFLQLCEFLLELRDRSANGFWCSA